MDKEERIDLEEEIRHRRNLDKQFLQYKPPNHPELPLLEQKLLIDLYTGFRKFYLAQRRLSDEIIETERGYCGFVQTNINSSGNCLGNYRIQQGRIVLLEISEKFIGLLPPEISQLSWLVSLKIHGHSLSHFPMMKKLPNISEISLTKCGLTKVPLFIKNCESLKSLNLFDNQIHTLPLFLGKIFRIKSFIISNNPIKYLPSFIGNWKECERLGASNCDLSEIPEEVFTLQKLASLSLKNNKIQRFPAIHSSGNILPLKNLFLEHNHLSSLPPSFKELIGLVNINLAYNRFSVLPDYFANFKLRNLNLSGNPLIAIPSFLQKMNQNFSLKINNTPIRSLSEIPSNFRLKQKIKDLDTGALHPDGLKNPNDYYIVPPITLAHKYVADKSSLSEEEKSRLKWEGDYKEREILEHATVPLPYDDPILESINERLRVESKKGYFLFL